MTSHPNRREFGRGAIAAATVVASGAIRVNAQAGSLKVGTLAPKSGFEAQLGQGCQRGFDLAVTMLRDMGTPVELMSADTESKPDVARTQAEKLIREGAHVLTGAFDSGQSAAIAQVAEQHGIPYIVNIAADPKITEQGYKFVFRNFPNAAMLMTGALTLVNDLIQVTGKTPKSAVLMAINDTFGQAARAAIDVLIPKLGMPFKVVETISYDPQARDLSVEVAKAKSAGADLHLCVTRLNDGILMVREMVSSGTSRWRSSARAPPASTNARSSRHWASMASTASPIIRGWTRTSLSQRPPRQHSRKCFPMTNST